MLYSKPHPLSSRVFHSYYFWSVARMEGNCHVSNRGRAWYSRRLLPYSTVPSSTSEQNATGLSRCLNRIACRLSSEAELRRISPIRGSFGDVFLVVLQLYLLGKVGGSLLLLETLFLVYSLNYILSIELYIAINRFHCFLKLTHWQFSRAYCPLPLVATSYGVLMHLVAFYAEQMHYPWGREEDAIASSDITKAPFVKWGIGEVTFRHLVQSLRKAP